MQYKQHEDNEILIPQHITRICLVTSHLILVNAYISYSYHYVYLSYLQVVLYFASINFWRKVKHGGWERPFDKTIAFISLSHGTYLSFSMPCTYRNIWLASIFLAMCFWNVNNTFFYYQIEYKRECKENIKLLNYIKPNTAEREMAYYHFVISHATFIHIFLFLVSSFVMYKSNLEL